MRCLICAENSTAELIKEDLLKTGLYNGWEFSTCNNAEEMLGYSGKRPDVLVASRFLPGMDPVELLGRIPVMFPASHIVLLVGRVDEKGRAYINAAMKRGLANIVTGKLPGDRPYNLLEALTSSRDGLSILEDEEISGSDGECEGNSYNISALAEKPEERGACPPEKRPEKESYFNVSPPSGTFNRQANVSANKPEVKPEVGGSSERDDFALILSSVYTGEGPESNRVPGRQKAVPDTSKGMRVPSPKPSLERNPGLAKQAAGGILGRKKDLGDREYPTGDFSRDFRLKENRKGLLVLTAANKGGVGKTTAAITLAVALARSRIPVVLWDLDLGGPDVAAFFGVQEVPGIETLAGRGIKLKAVENLLVNVEENLYVLPGPMDKTLPVFEPGEIAEIGKVLLSVFPVVLGDTAPEFWTKPWLEEIFPMADKVLAVVDQSKFSEQETAAYAPSLLSMGVTPEKISIILNRFSSRLHNARTVEKYFCSGFKKEIPVKILPKVVATIPEDWETHAQKGYKSEVAGLEDAYSQWHNLAAEIASMAGYNYSWPEVEKRGLFKFLKKR
ncbi:P-loop NTPase [Moorella naiadis]|uniref:nucleotide-binding protein n=1 Tax=Moorella naiadis (nom. illeg.) TaxID=3093670 RepID=UPI003D9CB741